MTGLKRVPRSTPTASWFKALRISSQGSGCGRTEIASPSRTATSTELQPPPSPVVAIHAPRRGEAEVDLAPGIAVEAQLGQEALPDQVAKSSKAICYDFQKGKCTRGDKCKYLHKARSQSPKTDKPNKGGKKINAVCTFWKKGKCTRGDKCRFLHRELSNNPSTSETAAPAPSEKPEKPRSPSPAPPRRRGSRGRSKSREQRPAACCILAAAAPEGPKSIAEDGDYWEVDFKKGLAIRHHVVYRKQWFIPDETCPLELSKLKGLVKVERVLPVHPLSSVEEWNWRIKVPKAPDTPWVGQSIFKIRKEVGKPQFKEWPQIRKIPIEGTGKHISMRARRFSTCYADAENCPKADPRDARFAVEAAKEIKGIVDCINSGVVPPCKFECEEEDITCEHCADVCKPACPSKLQQTSRY